MVDISEIFVEKEAIFLDACSFNRHPNWFREAVFPHRHYGDLSLPEIKIASKEYELFANYIDNTSYNVYFPPKVLDEMASFSFIMDKQFQYLEYSKHGILNSAATERRHALMRAKVWYDFIFDTGKTKVYSDLHSKDYQKINEVLIKVGDANKLKVKRYVQPSLQNKKTKEDKRADEELVACALYESLTTQKPVCLVTGDRDVTQLLAGFTCWCYHYDKSLKPIVNSLYSNPLRSWNVVRSSLNYVTTSMIIDDLKRGHSEKYF